jgi:hypothetical protein
LTTAVVLAAPGLGLVPRRMFSKNLSRLVAPFEGVAVLFAVGAKVSAGTLLLVPQRGVGFCDCLLRYKVLGPRLASKVLLLDGLDQLGRAELSLVHHGRDT